MTIRLWPTDYEKRSQISKSEKVLLKYASENFTDGHFVVDINPINLRGENSRMGFYISPSEGLISYTTTEASFNLENTESYLDFIEVVESQLYQRMLESAVLIVRKGNKKILKFPYKHILLFTNNKILTIPSDLEKKLKGFIFGDGFISVNTSKDTKPDLFSNFKQAHDPDFSRITDIEQIAIFERLAPEYAIVLPELEPIKIKESNKSVALTPANLDITGDEIEYKTFCLDDYQVSLVNEMGYGHRVILANPGAGKSVLLLSKAFKYASIHPDKKVLLTCYNANLSELYRFKQSCANLIGRDNLHIFTFHQLIKHIFEECLGRRLYQYPKDEDIAICLDALRNGQIDLAYDAIFIDEVQIFDPKYLDICYYLLKDTPQQMFLMAGDLNQSVKAQSRRGDVPWKKMEDFDLDFNGRVKYIERNYRNTKEIGDYLNGMLRYMNRTMEEHKMLPLNEKEYGSFKVGEEKSTALKIQLNLERGDIKKQVLDAIDELISKYNVNYSDIAILFPFAKYDYPVKYYILYWIKAGLDEMGIPYSIIIQGEKMSVKYSETAGVVISTIDSSLGLDFKAVILTGLYPYNYIHTKSGLSKISNWNAVDKLSDEDKEQVRIQLRKLYTAASRARDILYVISDLDKGSPMHDILIDRR